MACKTSPIRCVIMIILLFLHSKSSLACYGGKGGGEGEEDVINYEWEIEPTAGPGPDQSEEERFNVTSIKDAIDRNIKIAWGGWTPPPEVEEDWRNWLHEYQLKYNQSDFPNPENHEKIRQEREEEGNWPAKWMELGEGLGGVEPPPWAYTPKFTGKPDACNQSPRLGTCKAKHTRWGWNPYLDKCMTYTWSGCGGTLNNFVSQLKCEEKCAVPAPPSCSEDSGIRIED